MKEISKNTSVHSFNKELYALGLPAVMKQYLSHFFMLHGDILPPEGLYARLMKEIEKPLIEVTLQRLKGNQLQAAKLLGINRSTLRRKMKDLHISFESYRDSSSN